MDVSSVSSISHCDNLLNAAPFGSLDVFKALVEMDSSTIKNHLADTKGFPFCSLSATNKLTMWEHPLG